MNNNGTLSAPTPEEPENRNENDGSQADQSGNTPEPVNPFDPAAHRLSATSGIGVRRRILTIRCGKPDKTDYVRVHPDEDYRMDTALILNSQQSETYLVARPLWELLPEFITPVRLCTAVNRHGTPFLWMAKLPDSDGRSMGQQWHTSMLEAQALALESWVRVAADRNSGSYAVWEATGNLPEPQWPELTFAELLELAFKAHLIDTIEHPYLRELRGEV